MMDKKLGWIVVSRRSQRWAKGLALGLIWTGVLAAWLAVLGSPVGATTPPAPLSGTAPPAEILPQNHWARPCAAALGPRMPFLLRSGVTLDSPATWDDTILLLRSLPPVQTRQIFPDLRPSILEAALGLETPVHPLFHYPTAYFQPHRPIARAEAITALASRLHLPYQSQGMALLRATLQDGGQVPAYGQEAVAAAIAAGVLVNYPEANRLRPQQPITQGELAVLACQASGDPALQATVDPAWIVTPPSLPPTPAPPQETRGVWLTNIDSAVLFSQENLAAGVARLQALNFNTLYPVVWNGGYTLYPSPRAARELGEPKRLFPGNQPAREAAQGDRDLLAEIIPLARAANMAVIPWFEFGFMAPGREDYVLRRRHPDWFTQRRDGSQVELKGAEPFVWMNPFHPEVQTFLLDLVAEVLDRYPVDGIQWDDHLGLPVSMGYDPYTVALYQREHGGAAPPENENDPEWVRWRADKITAFVARTKALIQSKRPDGVLSISPNPFPFSYERYLQDWPTWEQRGLVDELVVQVYRSDLDRFIWELSRPSLAQARRRVHTTIGLLSGLRGRPIDGALLEAQVVASRDRGFGGVAYFFYETLWVPGQETPEERQQKFRRQFAQPAPRPVGRPRPGGR